ncbi:MAG TPA: pyridoxal-phosphate dependent enzyme [Burkholderiaceae bacterium]|nr:pyridoxal-phosphate dependent enzyme [Burkholderiaceae bacterium]
MALHTHTPAVPAPADYSRAGRPLVLKLDALQPCGSFKMRGIGTAAERAVAGGAHELVCPSGGNAGFAAAHAGARLGVPTSIVVPETTLAGVRERIAGIGAKVLVFGAAWDEAHEHALELARTRGAAYLHAFDHPDIWDGHATLIDECCADGWRFDAVACCVGGGGLLAGIVAGLERNGLRHVPVIAVETEGAASYAAALRAGAPVSLPAITSIATTLGAKRVCARAVEAAREHEIVSLTVTDAQAVAACLKFADAWRLLVEPSCGATLAALDVHADAFARFESILVEICGGIGVSVDQLAAWRTRFFPDGDAA